ncbi:MFS transporter [Bradyrhizobium sp. Ec3.3]|uniref:MFS transporter n=1 Tax=Bradyrhizobium sp. Ec3.3 TaxID=189753 RepID=UPI000419E345|nr:MFS transporter [Bradyrhizobium sp. Ec3.3]
MTMNATIETAPDEGAVSRRLTILLAAACGMVAANIYYAQPLIGPISTALGLSHDAAGLIVTMTQVGYGVGLLLIVPLGDLVENRTLICSVIGLGAAALLAAACATQALPFLVAALFIGLGSVAVQIIIPYAAHLAPAATRGRVVGNVSTGLMLGIMLARPVSSFLASIASWHAVFSGSTVLMIALAGVLWRTLPKRMPVVRLHYLQLLGSMPHLVRTTPVLRRRALYQAFLFGAFSLFWTVTPLLLASPAFGLSQRGIALFALAGVAGAVAAPIAGRIADRGYSRGATRAAMLLVAAAFLITHIGAAGSTLNLACLAIAAIAIDFGVQGNVVLGFRTIFALGPEHRSRLNGLYMATFFTAGAAGSALGGFAFAHGGWTLASSIGFALPAAALIYAAFE